MAGAAPIARFYDALGRGDAAGVAAMRRMVRHEDRFDLRGWLRQALGLKGALFGGLPAAQNSARAGAAKALAERRAACAD